MRLIRVMCSGRLDLSFILRAFSNGMDGVFIGGCRFNECNYVTHGNFHALNVVLLAKRIMEHIGLNPGRLRIEFMSGAEANLFVDTVNGFVRHVKDLGPLGAGDGVGLNETKSRIAEVTKLLPYIKLVNREKLASRPSTREEQEALFTCEEIDKLFKEVVSYYIDPAECQACSTCLKRCPADAITGGKNLVHIIDQEKCIKCGTCLEACPPRFGAVTKVSGESVPFPLPEAARTIVRKKKTDAA